MKKEKPKQIEVGEWLYKGCFIQESIHSQLVGKYEVFKNDEPQTHVGRCYTFTEAKKLCEENESQPSVIGSFCSRCENKPKHKESTYCIDCLYERKMLGY